jgi:broad specificity phosphatase PhoE
MFVDSELKERHFGELEGLVVNEVKLRLGVQPHERLVQHLRADAEQWRETGARSARVIGKWLERHPSDALLLVTRSGLFGAPYEHLRLGARAEAHALSVQVAARGWTCKAL